MMIYEVTAGLVKGGLSANRTLPKVVQLHAGRQLLLGALNLASKESDRVVQDEAFAEDCWDTDHKGNVRPSPKEHPENQP
jgi:hypothetical protein